MSKSNNNNTAPAKSSQPAPLVQVDYRSLVSSATEVDRKLDCQPDPRCKGLQPTYLQRQIMDSIDANHCTMVKAPSSSGKTLLSLYLVKRTRVVTKKVTLYVAPNKPLCNEFSLFVVKQKLNFAIGTEDFFSWKDMVKADVIICTPPILLKLLYMTDPHFNLLESVGAVIFDELPNTLKSHNEILPFILMVASSMKWQCLTLSATLNKELKSILTTLFPNIDYLEPQDAIRSVDLIIRNMDGKELKEIPTASLYTSALLDSDDALNRASKLPITLSEFKALHSQVDATNPNYAQWMSNVPSSKGMVNGIGLCDFALKYNQHMKSKDPNWDADRETRLNQLFIKKEPTAKELFMLTRRLGKKNGLPVMFFHSNKAKLEKYHKEVSDIVLKLVEKGTTSKKIPKFQEKDMLPDDNVGFQKWVNPFGYLGQEELAEIFKHKSSHGKLRLGFRGRQVQNSSYYPGIQQGIGIHHHDVEKPVRDAVESGLRMGYLRVVFCDYTMALGLNMPVKTVVFIGGDEEPIDPDDFVQASGRAGRWGLDTSGSVVFVGHSASQVKNIWNASSQSASCSFPISKALLLAIITGPKIFKSFLPQWLSYSIPQWNWTPEKAKKQIVVKYMKLKSIGAVNENNEIGLRGELCLAMQDEGDISFVFGYILSKFQDEFAQVIKTPKDFLFVCSHLLKPWRVRLEDGPTLASVKIAEETRALMKTILEDVSRTFGGQMIVPTDKITSLYVEYPDLTKFKSFSNSALKSYVAHFMSKMENIQRKAKLPFGDAVIEQYNKLNK